MAVEIDQLNEITEKIIKCAYKVSNTLGVGFLEKVYEKALTIELKKENLKVENQKAFKIYYENKIVGEYVADILVENKILVELKAVKEFDETHFAQCINYLKAANLELCLLINFAKPRIKIKRFINDIDMGYTK